MNPIDLKSITQNVKTQISKPSRIPLTLVYHTIGKHYFSTLLKIPVKIPLILLQFSKTYIVHQRPSIIYSIFSGPTLARTQSHKTKKVQA